MAKIIVAGLDPALRNFGMAKGALCLDTGIFDLHQIQLSEPKSLKMKVVRKNSDDLLRAKQQAEVTEDFLKDVDMVMVEIPVGSQSARAMASYGICIGILAGIKTPMIQVTPTEVKVASVGTKTATKDEIITWATNLYPEASWLTQKRKGEEVILAKNEHIADAIAAIHAGVHTDQFKQLHAALKAMRK